MVCAPAFASGFQYVYPDPEDYAIEEAIKSLEEIQQYRAYPSAEFQSAINMLGRMIGQVKREVEESHRDHQITIDEWIRMLEGEN